MDIAIPVAERNIQSHWSHCLVHWFAQLIHLKRSQKHSSTRDNNGTNLQLAIECLIASPNSHGTNLTVPKLSKPASTMLIASKWTFKAVGKRELPPNASNVKYVCVSCMLDFLCEGHWLISVWYLSTTNMSTSPKCHVLRLGGIDAVQDLVQSAACVAGLGFWWNKQLKVQSKEGTKKG